MSAAHPNPQSVLADIVRVLDGRRAARQDKIALAVGRRTSDNTLGLALAYGARAGVLRFELSDLSWSHTPITLQAATEQ